MSVCVVITAAGRCTRMGCFKPMLPVAGEPAVVHMLHTFFDAGVSHAVVVTGHRHETLHRICADVPHLTFVHNPDYMTTQMFDSIRLGLAAVPPECGAVLITPVDIPLVAESTVRAVLHQPGDIVFPSCQFRRGHPLKISGRLLPEICRYAGPGGLKGALASLNAEVRYAEVDDPFILMDMDTLREYTALIRRAEHCEVTP